jgi:hypothetical protein
MYMSNNERILDRLLYILIFSFLFLASSFFMFELLILAEIPGGEVLGSYKVITNK